MLTIGEYIHELRKKMGIPLKQAADRAGCAEHVFSLFEDSERPGVPEKIFPLIMKGLGCPDREDPQEWFRRQCRRYKIPLPGQDPQVPLLSDELIRLDNILSQALGKKQAFGETDYREIRRRQETVRHLIRMANEPELATESAPIRQANGNPWHVSVNAQFLAGRPEMVKLAHAQELSVSYLATYLESDRFRRHTGSECPHALAQRIRRFDEAVYEASPKRSGNRGKE